MRSRGARTPATTSRPNTSSSLLSSPSTPNLKAGRRTAGRRAQESTSRNPFQLQVQTRPSTTSATKSRSNKYTNAVVRGQHPRAVSSASMIWDYINISNDRLGHVANGERLYNVVEHENTAIHQSPESATQLTLSHSAPTLSPTNKSNSPILQHVKLQSFAYDANPHSHINRRASNILAKETSPFKVKVKPPPFTRSFLPARISTPKVHIKRARKKFYTHKEQKVEQRVHRIARRLGVAHTPNEQEKIDLSPQLFSGYVPTTLHWTRDNFSTYFNSSPDQRLLYGVDVGLETLGGSWLACSRKGEIVSRPVEKHQLGDKVTFRMIDFQDLLAYKPLVYGKRVWVVVVSGCGDQDWRQGSFLGAKVVSQVALPISEHVVDADADLPTPEMGAQKLSPNANVKRNNASSSTKMDRNHQMSPSKIDSYFSRPVGHPKPWKGCIPNNRDDYRYMIEKPGLQIQRLNEKHAPLGCWIIRPASSKNRTGDIVKNLDEVYLEQDFYYLSSGNISSDSASVVRQLPHDFSDEKVMHENSYAVDRRGVFRLHLADTNPSNGGLSVSDQSVERLENRAKNSLRDSSDLRSGKTEYAVVDSVYGVPKPLKGGEKFSLEMRRQIKTELEGLDKMTLKTAMTRNSDLHDFFGREFERVGPPDDDIIAKISGAASISERSLDGGESIMTPMTYGPVEGAGARPNSVKFTRQPSMFRHRDLVEADDSSSFLGNSTLASAEAWEEGVEDDEKDLLCKSVSVGSTFQKLRREDEILNANLVLDFEREDIDRRRQEELETARMKNLKKSGYSPPPPKERRTTIIGKTETEYVDPETNTMANVDIQKIEERNKVRVIRNTIRMQRPRSQGANAGDSTADDQSTRNSSVPDLVELKKKIGVRVRERTLLLPQYRPMKKEEKNFDDMIPSLLKGYTKESMISSLRQLDGLIFSRLTATERQRRFNELANFEQMAKENLEIEKQVREQEAKKEVETVEHRRSMRASRIDAVEVELAKRNLREKRATMSYKAKLQAEKNAFKLSQIETKYAADSVPITPKTRAREASISEQTSNLKEKLFEDGLKDFNKIVGDEPVPATA